MLAMPVKSKTHKKWSYDDLESFLRLNPELRDGILRIPESDNVTFQQAAFASGLSNNGLWELGAVVKIIGRYRKQVIIDPDVSALSVDPSQKEDLYILPEGMFELRRWTYDTLQGFIRDQNPAQWVQMKKDFARAEGIIFAQAAFAYELTDDEIWLLGAMIKIIGHHGKRVYIAPDGSAAGK
jgi:hypothetical protein